MQLHLRVRTAKITFADRDCNFDSVFFRNV